MREQYQKGTTKKTGTEGPDDPEKSHEPSQRGR